MTPYDFPGLVSGFIGSQLVLWGAVFALLSGLRALLVRGQPGRGHVARGILAGSVVLVAGGLAVFAAREAAGFERRLDAIGAPFLAGFAVLGAVWVALRMVRRRPSPGSSAVEAPAGGGGEPPRGPV